MRPSGENATAWTAFECPLRDSSSFPVGTSQTWTLPPRLAMVKVLPSGDKATSSTIGMSANWPPFSGLWSVRITSQVSVDQISAVPSRLPLVSSFPSLVKSRAMQKPVCPVRRWIGRRVPTSQTFSGLSLREPASIHLLPKPATRYFPSGENASADRAGVFGYLEAGQIGRSRQPNYFRSSMDVPQ